MIRVVCFKWHKEGYRSKYTAKHVNTLYSMVKRNTTVPFEFVCITDDPEGIDVDIKTIPLWENPCPRYAQGQRTRPNCFARLKMFSEEMKDLIGDKFVWMDLDTVIVSNIDHILSDPADFKMARIDGEFMPCNGSIVMIKAGSRKDIWENFNPDQVHPTTGFLRFTNRPVGSDQAWISMNMTDEEKENTFGLKDGVVSYRCHLRKYNKTDLPENTCMILFHGNFEPDQPEIMEQYAWVREHYK